MEEAKKNHSLWNHFEKMVSTENASLYHQLRIGVCFAHSCSTQFFCVAIFEMDRFQVVTFDYRSF